MPKNSDLSKLDIKAQESDSESEALSVALKRIDRLEKSRREDSFYFLFFFVLCLDAVLFIFLVDGGAAIALMVLELVFLLLLADRYDIKYIEVIFKRVAGAFGGNNSKDEE